MPLSIIFEDHNWQKLIFSALDELQIFSYFIRRWYIIIMTFTIQRLVEWEIWSWFVKCEKMHTWFSVLIGNVLVTLSIQQTVQRKSILSHNGHNTYIQGKCRKVNVDLEILISYKVYCKWKLYKFFLKNQSTYIENEL